MISDFDFFVVCCHAVMLGKFQLFPQTLLMLVGLLGTGQAWQGMDLS